MLRALHGFGKIADIWIYSLCLLFKVIGEFGNRNRCRHVGSKQISVLFTASSISSGNIDLSVKIRNELFEAKSKQTLFIASSMEYAECQWLVMHQERGNDDAILRYAKRLLNSDSVQRSIMTMKVATRRDFVIWCEHCLALVFISDYFNSFWFVRCQNEFSIDQFEILYRTKSNANSSAINWRCSLAEM